MVDMFSPQYFNEITENNSTVSVQKTASPKIGILGNSTFASFNPRGIRKASIEPTNSVNNQFKRIEVSQI